MATKAYDQLNGLDMSSVRFTTMICFDWDSDGECVLTGENDDHIVRRKFAALNFFEVPDDMVLIEFIAAKTKDNWVVIYPQSDDDILWERYGTKQLLAAILSKKV